MIKIRAAQLSDLAALHALELSCFTLPWSYSALEYELTSNPLARLIVLCLAEAEEQVLGYASYHLVIDEAEIMNIAVMPAWQGRGLGQMLLAEVIKQAQAAELRRITLEVSEQKANAQKLYRRMGFQQCGRRANYYADTGAAALIMELLL